MKGASFSRRLTRPVAGFTLLAYVALAHPAPLLAQRRVPAAAPRSSEAAYTLGGGDRIRLDIFNVPEYAGEYQVLVDGTLNLPVIGSVIVRGMTIAQATRMISAKYAPYVRRPIVTLSLVAARPLKIGVSGEVNRPGSYSIPLAEGRQFPSVTQAVTLAGGTTQSANVRAVQIRRRQSNGRQQTINVNLSQLLQTGSLAPDITLRDGDTVFIPTLTAINPARSRELATASFAGQPTAPLKIAVVGEVSRPGPYTVAPDTSTPERPAKAPTLTRAIQVAGGITPSADIRNVQIRRPSKSGRLQAIAVNLSQLLRAGDLTQDITLQDGDTVFIPTARSISAAESNELASASFAADRTQPLNLIVVGEVSRPGPYTVAPDNNGNGDKPTKPPTLTRAIQVAGGITPSADIRNVQIRRATRSGAVRSMSVNLSQLLRAGDRTQDVLLQDGDTIFIPTATSISPAESNELASASFAAERSGPLKIAVVGEVSRPGPHTVAPESTTPDKPTKPPTLTRAIQVAGGITPSADIRNIQIRRPTRNGSTQAIAVNLWQLLRQGDITQDLILQDGDTVFIPTAQNISSSEARQLAALSFAADKTQPLSIAVVGEVSRPGPYTVAAADNPNTPDQGGKAPTLTRAIQLAGGITANADIRQIQVRRATRNGDEKAIAVNLWQLLQEGDLTQDIILQEGDTISVPTATNLNPAEVTQLATSSFSPDKIRVNVVGEVQKPGTVEVPPNTPLNQALLASGSFNNRARRRSVDLIRLNPNGTVSKRPVQVDFTQGINEKNNPTLRNNDVIVVGRSNIATISDTVGTVLSPVGGIFSLFNFFRIFN